MHADEYKNSSLQLTDIALQLAETEKRFENMANAAPVMLWMARNDSLCVFFNQSWFDFSGRTLEEEWGIGWADRVHFEDLQRCLDTYIDAFCQRQGFEMEYRLQRHDGIYRTILDRGVPRYSEAGYFAGYIGSCIDITEHKDTETKLRNALNAKNEFLSLISHELCTPLTSLSMQLELLQGSECFFSQATDWSAQEILEKMKSSTERLSNMIQTLLHYSRIERGHLIPRPRYFSPGTVVAEVIEKLSSLAKAQENIVRVISQPIPQPLFSDPELFDIIVTNLLSNAVKFTQRGVITLALTVADHMHQLVVSDKGCGIAKNDLSRIFEPFEQSDHYRHKHVSGVGLGLSLVKSLTQALHGQVAVASEIGIGSSFTVILPHLKQ
jgi:PAS domain S-box-containing protein